MSFDQISDMLSKIRNGQEAGKADIFFQYSKMKLEVAKVMNKENYVGDVSIHQEGNKKFLKIKLKYDNGEPVVVGIKRISRQGKRIYVGKKNIPIVKNGYGIAILSTSKGVLTNKQAINVGVGGEVICEIW